MSQNIFAVHSIAREISFDEGDYWRARLGFILLPNEYVVDRDIARMTPKGVGVSVTRLKTPKGVTVASLAKHIEGMAAAASVLLPDLSPSVVAYACTSGSIVIGEERVMAEIRKGAPWAEPTTLITGVINGLRALRAKRIVVATPYLDEVNAKEAEYLTNKGFDVLDIQGLNIERGYKMGLISPGFIKDFALSVDRPDADAIFVSCGGIRTLDVLQEIEDEAGKPVVASNQALMWDCLRRAGIEDKIGGYGRLFDLDIEPIPTTRRAS